MIARVSDKLEKARINDQYAKALRGEPTGHFIIKGPPHAGSAYGRFLELIASSGIIPEGEERRLISFVESLEGWEHVSVSIGGGKDSKTAQPPSWEEMCFVKDLFWLPEEWVVQYHPAKSDHINNHPGVLHLWRPVDGKFPTPPKFMV